MFGFMLFLHLIGLVAWVGSMLAIVVMLSILKNQFGSPESNKLGQRIIRTFSLFAHPAAVIVLISGVFMMIQAWGGGSEKPVWLDIMEKGGGTIILLALILTGILGGRVKRSLKNGQGGGGKIKLSGYLTTLTSLMVLVAGVVLIVSLRI